MQAVLARPLPAFGEVVVQVRVIRFALKGLIARLVLLAKVALGQASAGQQESESTRFAAVDPSLIDGTVCHVRLPDHLKVEAAATATEVARL